MIVDVSPCVLGNLMVIKIDSVANVVGTTRLGWTRPGLSPGDSTKVKMDIGQT